MSEVMKDLQKLIQKWEKDRILAVVMKLFLFMFVAGIIGLVASTLETISVFGWMVIVGIGGIALVLIGIADF